MTRIDTHQHLWDLEKFSLPWLPLGGPFSDSHPPERYLEESVGLGIEQTIYMEVDVSAPQKVAEAHYVYGLCDDPESPMVGAVIGGEIASSDLAKYLDATAHPARKGVRQVLHGNAPRGQCLTPEFQRGLRLLGERGLLFDFCIRPFELSDAATCARQLPQNRFVLDHCGNAPIHGLDPEVLLWKQGMEKISGCPNVVCKLSGIVAQADPTEPLAPQLAPFVNFTLDAFGPERVLFASDWPVCKNSVDLKQWVNALDEIVAERPESERWALFFENARRVYGV
jgi:L-fuconolactonase